MNKNTAYFVEEIKSLVVNDKLEEAIEKLDKNYHDQDLVNLLARVKKLGSDNIKGTISHTDYTLERNRIRDSLLIKVNNITKDKVVVDKFSLLQVIQKYNELIFLLVGLTVLIILSRYYSAIDSKVLTILLPIIFWVSGIMLGLFYNYICFYGEIIQSYELDLPNPRNGYDDRVAYFRVSIIILFVTYFASEPLVTPITYTVLFLSCIGFCFVCIGLFVNLILARIGRNKDTINKLFFQLCYFIIINTVLYSINHPVTIKFLGYIDKGISYLVS